MKKILLSLFTLISVNAIAQVTESVTFDFSKPSSLNPNPVVNVNPSPGDIASLYQYTFKNGPVSLSFVDYGQGVMLNCTFNGSTPVYTLSMRQRSSMKISVNGSTYALSSISFSGSIGSIKEVSSSTKRWTASDQNTKSIEFHNGTEESFIRSITVNYTRASKQVNFKGLSLNTIEPISSFKSTELEFDQEISTIANSDGIKLYQLDSQNGDRIEGMENDLDAVISTTNPKKVIVSLKNDAEIKADGYFELYVPAGAFKSIENSSTLAISVPFEILSDKAIFYYDSALSPDPKEGTYPMFPYQITLTYEKNVYLSDTKYAKVYPVSNPADFYVLNWVSDGHDVILEYTDDPLLEGDYVVEIARGSITNGAPISSSDFMCNPTIKLYYKVENEKKTLLSTATQMLDKGGKETAYLGYPANDSEGRKALVAVVNKGFDCTIEELKTAIQAYNDETNVRLPETDSWYTIAAVNSSNQPLYLRYHSGKLELTASASNATSFKALKNEGDQTISFKTTDDKFLHVKSVDDADAAILNLTMESGIHSQVVERMLVEGKHAGFVTLKDNDYAVVAFGTAKVASTSGSQIQYGSDLTSAFVFTESTAEQNMVIPTVAFLDNEISRPGISLVLSVTNVDDAILSENPAPYFTKDGVKVSFEGTILTKNPNHRTQFYVNTTGLQYGSYTLVLPKGTFICTKDGELTADVDLARSFKITAPSGEETTGFIEDFGLSCYQKGSRSNPFIRDKDLEEMYLYAYGNEEIGGIYCDPTKPVYIVQAFTDGVLATGHFEPYPTFSEDTGFGSNAMAVRLVMDEPLKEGELDGSAGEYGYKILAGTVGDRNFKRYLDGDPDVSKSDCHVNKLDYSITFTVNNTAATAKYPSSEVLTEARQLVAKTGVGYPASDCASRLFLKNKVGFVEGDDEEYINLINDFYNEEIVEKPVEGKYYKVYALGDDKTKAYLNFDGVDVAVTSDATQATGFKMVANANGTYQFVTGNKLYLRLLSNEFNTTDYYQPAANDIILQKLKIDGVDAKKTFGLFSMKMEGVFPFIDVKNAKILPAETSLIDFSSDKSCAFMFEEVAKESIPLPEIQKFTYPATGSNVESLDVVRITFLGAADLELANNSLITMTDSKGNSYTPSKVTVKDYHVDLEFEVLQEGAYFLNVAAGAFKYTFAEMPRLMDGVVAAFNIVPTGISNIYINASDDPVYDLQGRRVSGVLKSGIYIKNGKKVYIK